MLLLTPNRFVFYVQIENKHSNDDRSVDSFIINRNSGGDGYAGGGSSKYDGENDGDGDTSDSDIGDADHDSIVTCKVNTFVNSWYILRQLKFLVMHLTVVEVLKKWY